MEISTPCRIATPQNVILKFDTRDYVRDMTHMQILGRSVWLRVLPNYVKYNTFVTFYTVLTVFFLDPLHRSNHGSGAHA